MASAWLRVGRLPAPCLVAIRHRCTPAPMRKRFQKGLLLMVFVSTTVQWSSAASGSAKKKRKLEPLCHQSFRVLETCLGSNYDRLKVECAGEYDRLQACLSKEWTHIDDSGGYKRPHGAFNRVRNCRHGLMMYNPLDWYIGRSLEVYGEWGERKVHMLQRIVKAGHVVVDIGAHVGTLTVPLSKLVGPTGQVTAFEPFYPSFQTLAANIGLNSILNVEVRQAVVSDRFGKLYVNRDNLAFGMHDFFNFGSMGFDTFRIYNASDDVERPSSLWDEYQVLPLDHMSVSRLDFIKVDAETMEINVLEGAHRIIKKFKPVIFIEYRNPWEKDSKVLEFLRKKMKYECVLLRIPIWNAENFRGHDEDIWSVKTKLVSFNLLCKHRWWEYPDMDDAVLELFDTAVDTDIEGLRTTPTADPFEAMALGAAAFRASGPQDTSGQSHDRDAVSPPPLHHHPPSKDLTLDELLGDSPSPQPRPQPQKVSKATPKAQQKRAEELTLDELLAGLPEDAPKRSPAPIKSASQKPQQKVPEEMTLDELLASVPETQSGPGTSSTKSQSKMRSQKAYEDMTLDELLATVPESQPQVSSAPQIPASSSKSVASKAKNKPLEDMTLDELLDQVAPVDGGGRAAAGGTDRVKSKDEKILDELLGPADPAKDAEADRMLDELLGGTSGKDMTLEELLGSEAASKSFGAKTQDLTLDELLGQEPPQAKPKAKSKSVPAPSKQELTLDELLGEVQPQKAVPEKGTKQNKELTLDELLGESEPHKPTPKKAAKPKGQSKPRQEEMTLDELLGESEPQKPKQNRAAGQSMQKPSKPKKMEPDVRVKYEPEITIDEL
eukprot:gnl/MRDRNA2_/MRDRNA2_105115_c0_seq1.p1 gnl/MRDRNA2_/MRDRNA2_105115_c0~~gnl/MRDRNA2_/MRDRNA2_105115_c0_seq1.p1  ORF type:complete len:844 (+),score=182.10 gnl/MRDRNA2_/MRDRNA2_105115_c0_seq1:36-2534(+)